MQGLKSAFVVALFAAPLAIYIYAPGAISDELLLASCFCFVLVLTWLVSKNNPATPRVALGETHPTRTRQHDLDRLTEYHLAQLQQANQAGDSTSIEVAARRLKLICTGEADGEAIPLIELIDELMETAALTLSEAGLVIHVLLEGDQNPRINATGPVRQVLLHVLVELCNANTSKEITFEVSVSNSRLTVAIEPGVLELSISLMDEIGASGGSWSSTSTQDELHLPVTVIESGKPLHLSTRALIVSDNDNERRALTQRLLLLGCEGMSVFSDASIDRCIVRDRHASNFLAIASQLPGQTRYATTGDSAGEGWTTLNLPLTQQKLKAFLAEPLVEAASRKHLLIVDDNETNLTLIARQAEVLDCEVKTATTGEAALRLANRQPFTLILMDLQLPGISGIEATRALVREGHMASIVGLTAHSSVSETRECIEAGMQQVLTKPIRFDQLQTLLGGEATRRKPRAASARDLPVFDESLALAAADMRPALASELMQAFIDGLPDDLAAIKQAATKAALARAVHRFHGAVRFCGLPRLMRAVEALESSIKAGRDDSDALLKLMLSEAEAVELYFNANRDRLFSNGDNAESDQPSASA